MQSANPLVFLDNHFGDINYQIKDYVSATSFKTAPIPIMRRIGYSMQFTCPATGSPDGVVSIEVCNDLEGGRNDVPDSNLVNWVGLAGGSSAVLSDSIITIDHFNVSYRWMRVVYTRNSGSITATINLHTKAI